MKAHVGMSLAPAPIQCFTTPPLARATFFSNGRHIKARKINHSEANRLYG